MPYKFNPFTGNFDYYETGSGLVPTKTSDLINDGDDGVSHFISLNDLPSNLILYPTTAASDIPTYFKLVSSITDPSYDTVAVDVSTGVITTTNQFISALITTPNVIVGNPGVLNISTIGNIRRTAGTGNAEFYFEVWKRDLAGIETLITTSGSTPPVFNGTFAEFSATALWNDGIFVATDRIVLKFYGSRVAGGSNPTYDFQFGGSSPVRSLVPLPLTVVPPRKGSFGATIDATTTGFVGYITIPYSGTITGWQVIGDAVGNCVIDVWKTSAGVIPTVLNTITGTEKPTLSSQQISSDLNLTTWTISVLEGDIIGINLDSASLLSRIWLTLFITKTS